MPQPGTDKVNHAQDHPLAHLQDGVELAGRPSAASHSLASNFMVASPSWPPNQPFPPPPPPLPVQAVNTAVNLPTILPPTESPTRTLDEFVDYFLLSNGADSLEGTNTTQLHPDPVPADIPDFEKLKLLVSRRSYSDVAILTHRLLSGPNSHYAPIWQSLLTGSGGVSGLLALESQQDELLQIALIYMQSLVKLKRYNELVFSHCRRKLP
jgi:hypothetical protein